MSDGTRDGRQRPPFPPPPLIELLPAPGDVFAAAPPRPERPRYGLALLLFGLTFLFTSAMAPVMYILSRTDVMLPPTLLWENFPFLTPRVAAWTWHDPHLLAIGLSFSATALTILLAHELGHYIACRIYGLPCTLPYFLPVPLNFGTFGAFIRIKAPIRDKRQLFDVGIAGPIAGFVTLIPFLLYGIAKSQPAPLTGRGEILAPGHCLAIELATWLFHGRLAKGMILNLHPVALGAWLGLLATAINLLPLGQLDGGHILYAATGRLQRRLALPLWLVLGVMGFYWVGWFLWCAIVMLIGLYHPPVYDESAPLDPKRRLLAWLALAMLVLSFMPVPLRPISLG